MGSTVEFVRTGPGIMSLKDMGLADERMLRLTAREKARAAFGEFASMYDQTAELPMSWYTPEKPRRTKIYTSPEWIVFEDLSQKDGREIEIFAAGNQGVTLTTFNGGDYDRTHQINPIAKPEELDILTFRLAQATNPQ